MIRWVFTDPSDDSTWTVPINPNEMTSPYPTMSRQTMGGIRGSILTLQAPTPPFEWSFGGVIRTQAHYDALLTWRQKNHPVLITDHYARTWQVLLTDFDPEDRKPTPNVPWRLRYTMRALMFGRTA